MEEEDIDQDNTESAISEELSRFSSPSISQSSSCTSISNPFYDGPMRMSDNNVTVTSNHTSNTTCAIGNSEPSSQNTDSSNSNPPPPSVSVYKGRRQSSTKTKGMNPYNSGNKRRSSSFARQSSQNQSTSSGLEMDKFRNLPVKVIVTWDFGYLCTIHGFVQLLQVIVALATLICLVQAGAKEGGLLSLPLSWHFRVMLFVLVLSLLLTSTLIVGNVTSLIAIFGLEWTFFDFMIYSLFTFLYLVGSSLVASAFDFYEKIGSAQVSMETINQLVISVVLGYLCMVLHCVTAFLSFRKWKYQYRLYHRRKLIEEDEIDL